MSEIEKAIECLSTFELCPCVVEDVETAKLAVQALQEKAEREKHPNGWIPVSKRLPAIIDGSLDHSELYLVTVKNDKRTYTYLAYFSSCSGFSGLFGGDWNDCVIAWQPLPEPYEGERK